MQVFELNYNCRTFSFQRFPAEYRNYFFNPCQKFALLASLPGAAAGIFETGFITVLF